MPSCVWYFIKLLERNGLCGLIFLAGAGLALGLDLACGKQGALGEGRADEFIHKHGEQHDVAHNAAVCEGRSRKCHAECHAGLRQKRDAEVLFDVVAALRHGAADVGTGDLTERAEDDVNDADEQNERIAQDF